VAEQYQVSGGSASAISASIETGVREGRIEPGAALPPVRTLAEELGLSPATVAKAYGELRRRGVVEAHGRRGTRVRSRPPVAPTRGSMAVEVAPGVHRLWGGEPSTQHLPRLGPLLAEVAAELGDPIGYSRGGALAELSEAARERLAGGGVPMADAQVTVTGGALDAIERLFTVHLRPGDSVAVEDPGWAHLFDLIAALGLRAVPMEMDQSGPMPGSLERALSLGVRAVVITSRAQNPTGAAVSSRRRQELRTVLAAHRGVLLIEDDHAAELATTELHCIGPVTGSWAFVRSASKPFGPDLRIAVVAGDATSIARVAGRMRIGSGWVSTMLQRLLLRVWRDESVGAWVETAAGVYANRREALLRALRERAVEAYGSTGLNVWVRVPDETRAVSVLREAGFAVAPGSMFRIDSPPGIRITVSDLVPEQVGPVADAVADAVHPATVPVPSR
jgi:DNA-binding transcriptional MocR family regulator